MIVDVIDLVTSDLADLDAIQLIDLSIKALHMAIAKIEEKEQNNEE